MRTPAPLALLATLALLALPAAATAGDAPPVAAPPAAAITAHAIEIRFEPATHAFVARDRLTLAPAGPARLRFVLPPQVNVHGLTTADGAVVATTRGDAGHPGLVAYDAAVPAGVTSLSLAYGGTIFDAVQKQENLAWVVGDSTRGLIGEQGIYLNGGSGWYPRTESDGMMRFDVTSWVPAPFLVVTQGRPPQRSTLQVPVGWTSDTQVEPTSVTAEAKATSGWSKSVALAEIPSDGCDLVAGPYVAQVREVKGVQVATYFLPGEAPDAGLWLDAAAEVVARYEPILGAYPHKKFDVVENFFSTGYGMPSFTLLGDDVIRYVTAGAKGTGKIPPGYLDHEYVHGWYGNGLFVDPKDGNWCEGATTYYSNYLAKELESASAGAEHRRGVLEKYAIRIRPENDYPVRAFASKTEDKDNDVGYGKASMIFHVLRRRLGDAEFFARVKRLSQERVGTYVSWDDWLTTLDGAWAKPFLERKGLPAVKLVAATAWPAADGTWHVRAEASVEQPRGEAPWPDVDLDVDVDGAKVGTLRLVGKSGVWRGVLASQPKTLELDARYETMRAIAPTDLPACLHRTLESPAARVVVDGTPAFDAVARKISAGKGLPIVQAADAKDDGTPTITLMLLGKDASFRFPADGEALVEASATSVKVGGATHTGPGLSFLFSAPASRRPDGTLAGARTWFVACDEKALGRANYLTYYGWDQYAAFQAGNRTPVGRGFLDRTPKGTARAVTLDEAAVRVAADVERLSSDAFGGRAPGTPGHEAARAWLSDRLETLVAAGPHALAEMPFGLGVPDLASSRDLTITTASGTEVLRDAFRPLWGSPARAPGALPFADGAGAVPLPAKLPDTSPDGLARFWRQVDEGTAPAILVAPSPEARAALAPFLDTPAALTEAAVAELGKPGRDGKPRPRPSLPHWISGRRARAFPGAGPLRVPVLVLEESAVAALEAKKPTKVDFTVTWGPGAAEVAAGLGGVNLTAVVPAKDAPAERPSAVLVCAHYDAFGTVDGKVFRGADDNATGVACVLEALRGLPATVASGGTKHSLIVVFFDGEEWGLVGSRAVATTLASSYDLRAVVAVDSVGRVRDDTVFVVGQGVHAELGAAATSALAAAGLRAGPDIDKYAFTDGSDHYPFHLAKVPSILLWASDYGVMNTADDDPALVDPVGVARLATALRGLLTTLLTR